MTREFYMNSRRWALSIPLVAIAVIILTAVAFHVAELLLAKEHEAELKSAASVVAGQLDAVTLNGPMTGAAQLAATVDPDLKRSASGKAGEDDPATMAKLAQLRAVFKVPEAFVADGEGRIVAYNIEGKARGTGSQIGFRPYFRQAMEGRPNIYLAIGTNTAVPGVYFATPITATAEPGSPPVGVLVTKPGIEPINRILAEAGRPALLLSPQGVVFAASRTDWLFRVAGTVTPDRVAAIKASRQLGKVYDAADPQPLPFDPAAALASIDGREFSVATASLTWNDPGGAWTVVLAEDRSNLLSPGLRFRILSVIGAVIGLLGVSVVLLLQAVAHRRAETERVRKLSRAVEHSPVGTVIADAKRIIQYVNPRLSEVAGYPGEALVGKDLARLVAVDSQPVLERALAGDGMWSGELVNTRQDGSAYWAEWGVSPIRDAGGAATHLVALVDDITARKELERQVAAAHDEIKGLNRRLAAENVRLGAEIDVSRRIQQMILPTETELAQISGLDVAAFMEPAAEVGGDYYDVLQDVDGRVRIGIGDVTGHGLESGVVMLMTQSAVRTLVTGRQDDAGHVLDVLNRTIGKNVERMGSDKNMTLALLDYRPGPPPDGSAPAAAGHLRVTGQHESVIVARDGGRIELFDTVDLGFPIGLVAEVRDFVNELTIPLAPGDTVVLYTDGITEAADPEHKLYGLDRLCEVVSGSWAGGAHAIKAAVLADVRRHVRTQPLYDDLTLVVLRQS